MRELLGKISFGNANARDMLSLKSSVKRLPELKKLLKDVDSNLLKGIYENLDELTDIYELIEKAISDEPRNNYNGAEIL